MKAREIIEESHHLIHCFNLWFHLFLAVVISKFLNDFGQGVHRGTSCTWVKVSKLFFSSCTRAYRGPFFRGISVHLAGHPFCGCGGAPGRHHPVGFCCARFHVRARDAKHKGGSTK